MLFSMSVTKPHFTAMVILMILADKMAGGLFGFRISKRPWIPCELYHGVCRNSCEKYEIQYLTCSNNRKCCLKFPT
ncbi:beta-defensin 116 [Alexandromys fortis]|uniref:beta-defensin 116 n=1 Tax=Alexandromys fortis TaxID=100897 RepID=UPI0021529B88|nr:beta-defensin 116 [Microtus fortis]